MPSKVAPLEADTTEKKDQNVEQTVEQPSETLSEPPPENWPEDITFLTGHTYSDAITDEQKTALGRRGGELEAHSKIPADQVAATRTAVKIKIVDDPKHPAYGQRGLFAAEHLIPDRFICLYLGHVHNNSMSDTDPHSDYDLSLDRDIGLSVDAARSGNESRCANDYRGIAERPNAEFRDCFVKVPSFKRAGGTKWERRVGIFVLSAGKAGKRKAGIKADEEVLVSYGKSFWESRKLMAGFRKDFEMLKVAEAALEH